MVMNTQLIKFIRELYNTKEFIPLHQPIFNGNEKNYVNNTIESTFVSSVGKYVDQFESDISRYTGTPRAVATVNGTAALHTALYMAGVRSGDLVITQSLTFVATCNALFHMGAKPIFVDVSKESLGLCPQALALYLNDNAYLDEESNCRHRISNQRIRAVVPMHTFGHPVELDEILSICKQWNILLVEDAAESLGSFYKGKHTGTIGEYGALSFNGNKIITTGGGGMVLCSSLERGERTKHVTTTAKIPHPYEFYHDEPGFNFRMPNINAALGCAQLEALPKYLECKRRLAGQYKNFFAKSDFLFVTEPSYALSNYWLNAIICPDVKQRENVLQQTNAAGVMTRPVWKLMHRLPMFKDSYRGDLHNSEWIEAHLINLPSTPILLES
ncbi:LegC family aminotransferase [Pectobacterium parvum]|uniref:LegC family aminotransferase n=2 Tax=Pectobacteriaceae TaxID=1903410 RepID=UPI000DC646F8|nr:LegC family aminotransferase [Pectobacterium parvum]UVD96378.1 LegC family aminotransferase [Pectobacterium parvum]